jgi:murein peptide amidase A
MSLFASRSSPHNSHELLRQWQRLAKLLKLTTHHLGKTGAGQDLLLFQTKPTGPAVYLSAGVHGDEPAAPWALLAWAWNHQHLLRERAFLIAPCLNPDGLLQNTRLDEKQRDLNRLFHTQRISWLKTWHTQLQRHELRLALCLHEDYDARGCYVYSTGNGTRPLVAEVMAEVNELLPCDPRRKIEGQSAKSGVIHFNTVPTHVVGPEALVLQQRYGCPITLNFETPSEFDLDQRMEAQQHFIQASLRLFC